MSDPTAPPPPPALNLNDRSRYVINANIALCILGTIAVIVRLFTRLFVLRAPGLDDVFITLGLLFCIGETVLICVQTKFGLGKDFAYVAQTNPEHLPEFFKIMYALILIYIIICFFVKVSIVLFYQRLSTKKVYRQWVWGLIVLNVLVLITMGVPCAFGCKPLNYFWDNTIPGGKCIDQQKVYIVNVALNVFLDFATLILPMPMVWKAQMAFRKKIIIIGMFALGGFVCIASLIRVTKLFSPAAGGNITKAAVESHTWSMIECYMGVIVACVPTYKPLFKSCMGEDTTKNSSYGNSSHGRMASHKSGYVTEINGVEMGTARKNGMYPVLSEEDLIRSKAQHGFQ